MAAQLGGVLVGEAKSKTAKAGKEGLVTGLDIIWMHLIAHGYNAIMLRASVDIRTPSDFGSIVSILTAPL